MFDAVSYIIGKNAGGGGGTQPQLFAPIVTGGINEISWDNNPYNGEFDVTIAADVDGITVTSPLTITEDMDGSVLTITASAENFEDNTVRIELSYITISNTLVSVSNATISRYVAPALEMNNCASSFEVLNGTLRGQFYYAPAHLLSQTEESWEIPFSLKLNEPLSGNFEIEIRASSSENMSNASAFNTRFSVTVLNNGQIVKTITNDYYPKVFDNDFNTQAGDVLVFIINAVRA